MSVSFNEKILLERALAPGRGGAVMALTKTDGRPPGF